MLLVNRLAVMLCAVALVACVASAASAESPARVRTLTCDDGTTFVGKQVRHGGGRPPHTWRNVERGEFPTAFTFHAVTMIAPGPKGEVGGGPVVPSETWDNAQGVDRNKDLVTCRFVIPEGPLEDHLVIFEGFFVP